MKPHSQHRAALGMRLLHVTDRKDWRRWLRKHYRSESEIWLVFYKKKTGTKRVSYNDAVEEALCFGWIDSKVRAIDDERFAQRFSRRNPKSSFSQSNKERLRAMLQNGRVARDVRTTLGNLSNDLEFAVPPDILRAIKSNKTGWKNFSGFSKSYIRIRIAFIAGARGRPMEFKKRLRYFVRMSARNKLFGFGGIDKYY